MEARIYYRGDIHYLSNPYVVKATTKEALEKGLAMARDAISSHQHCTITRIEAPNDIMVHDIGEVGIKRLV